MQTIYVHISSLVGLFVFLSHLMRFAPIDRTILTGVSSGIGVYVVLTIAGVIVRRIIVSGAEDRETQAAADSERTARGNDAEPAPAA